MKCKTDKKNLTGMRKGSSFLFTGCIYTARDQAHKKLVRLIRKNQKLPLSLKGQIIYYCGPTAAPNGRIIGSCGPTTSCRMDSFLEPLLKKGLLGMIGKGPRSRNAREMIKKYKGVYFLAPSGCGALLAKRVVSRKLVAFPGLGPEAIYKLEVADFPLIVAIDSCGHSIYPDI
ncbi:MAG: FumA C-terminus/TtdB family hydratase beta subunit [Candidatus Omnitrophica bacterium]|nr:FumA C-terminus/TtdB family hydratase beta subunit [Candidatus Omnitrophota bacterium]MDD5429953.1 FumA C-terminus/TtdB family hydratase beta subunit [Candidatus Omnitrophota bacterium]